MSPEMEKSYAAHLAKIVSPEVTVTLSHEEFIVVCTQLVALGANHPKVGVGKSAFSKLIRAAQVANGMGVVA